MSKTDTAAENGVFIRKDVPFTQVPNRVLRDKHLSLGAKGLFSVILSYITIPNFTLYKAYLRKINADKKYSFDKKWTELKSSGYLIVNHKNTKNGMLWTYELLESPYTDIPSMGSPSLDNPSVDKRVINNTYNNKTDHNNSDNTKDDDAVDLRFPEVLDDLCEDVALRRSIEYAMSQLSADDSKTMHQFHDHKYPYYLQIVKEVYFILENKFPNNVEGYALKVLENKIVQYGRYLSQQ